MSRAIIIALFATGLFNTITFADVQATGETKNAAASHANSPDVRVVSDLNVINGHNGVPVEFWYNETNPISGELASATGCPQSIDGIPWIYYGQPPRCYLAGTYGPCPPDEKLLPQRGSPDGVCACECLSEYDYSEKLLGKDRYVRCFRSQDSVPPPNEQIFDKEEKRCYFMYEKGPCEEGTVLTDMTSNSLECLPLCDKKQPDWEEKENAGLCKTPKYVLSASSSLGAARCPDDQVFSKILDKCIRRTYGQSLVVG